jgi:hypothetical protein
LEELGFTGDDPFGNYGDPEPVVADATIGEVDANGIVKPVETQPVVQQPVVEAKPVEQPVVQPQVPQYTQEQIQQFQEAEARKIDETLTKHYELTPEDAEVFPGEQAKVIQKLLVKAHKSAFQHAAFEFQQNIGPIIQNALQQKTIVNANVEALVKAAPKLNLNDPAHKAMVTTVGNALLAQQRMLPQASRLTPEQFINKMGLIATLSLNLDPGVSVPGGNQQPAATQTPSVQQQASSVPVTPSRAAGSGSTVNNNPPNTQANNDPMTSFLSELVDDFRR